MIQMQEYTDETPLFHLSVGQLKELLRSNATEVRMEVKTTEAPLKGHKAAANFLGISVPSIIRLKNEGLLDGAFTQKGRIILYDRKKLLDVFGARGTPATLRQGANLRKRIKR